MKSLVFQSSFFLSLFFFSRSYRFSPRRKVSEVRNDSIRIFVVLMISERGGGGGVREIYVDLIGFFLVLVMISVTFFR